MLQTQKHFSLFPFLCLLMTALPVVWCSQGVAEYQSDHSYHIDIPETNAATALNLLAEQADVYLVFPYKLASKVNTGPLTGEYSLQEALNLLLDKTGLEGRCVASGDVVILPVESLPLQQSEEVVVTEASDKPIPQETIDEVIVTAQKRTQNILEVPVSTTVFDAVKLTQLRVDSGVEVARQTPNLGFSLLGNESQPKFSLRGVSTAEINLNAISPTGVFFDEVYVGASYLGGAQVFDVERVEVLRGPQGTLFGKNTTAGAINFISRAPTFESSGYLSIGAGSNQYRSTEGAIELPIVDDQLSARLAFATEHSDGYINNLNPDGRDLSSIDRQAFRLTLGYKDEDELDVTFQLFKIDESPDAIGAINQGLFNGLNAAGFNPRRDPASGQALSTDEVITDRSGALEVRGKGGYLRVDKDFDRATLTSITSYLDGRFNNQVDADGTLSDLIHLDYSVENRELSQDLRLTSNDARPFSWIVGLYYFRDVVDVNTVFRLFNDPVFLGTGITLDQRYTQTRESYATYADINYRFGDIYTFYAGLRYTEDEGTLSDFRVTPVVPVQSGDVTYSDGEPTGRLGLKAQVSDNLMIYGQVTHGYRSSAINGGALSLNALTVADPEKLLSYEVGFKSQWLNQRLTLSGSAFYYNFRDQQFINVAGIGQQQLVNAGKSVITGTELEVSYSPIDDFSLSAGLGLLDSEYKQLNLNGIDASGNELIEAPGHTFNMAADYRLRLENLGLGDVGSLLFHLDVSHVASQHFLASNDPVAEVGSFWDAGAVITYRSVDEKIEVALYGKNLTDNDNSTGVQVDPTSGTLFSTVPYPRRYGIELTYNF